MNAVLRKLLPRHALTILFVFLLGTVLFRFMPEPERKNFQNLDATLHVLLTMETMAETPAKTHKFLPIVTLGAPSDKFVSWGAAKFDKQGNGIYTSFPPLGFVIPYATLRAFSMPPSINSLFLFNILTQFASVFLAFGLAITLCRHMRLSRQSSNVAAFVATLPYIFSTEVLYSHGYVYWGHSLFQVFILLFLTLVIRQAFSGKPLSVLQGVATGLSVVLMCATEWTGFLVCAALPFALWFARSVPPTTRRALSVIVICSAGATGLLLLAWFASSIGLDVLLDALHSRFVARNFSTSVPISDLLKGYRSSFGLFLCSIPIGLAVIIRARRDHRIEVPVFLLMVALVAISENILMKQHAIAYHFDRLKMLLLFTATVPLAWFAQSRTIKVVILVAALIASVYSITNYRTARFYEDIAVDTNAAYLRGVTTSDGTIATQLPVRGFIMLMYHRNVSENVSFHAVPSLVATTGKPVYWLDSDFLENAVLRLKGIYRYDVDGSIKHYSQVGCAEQPLWYVPMTVNGCARSGEIYVRSLELAATKSIAN